MKKNKNSVKILGFQIYFYGFINLIWADSEFWIYHEKRIWYDSFDFNRIGIRLSSFLCGDIENEGKSK
jgi:hypothetical protein